jgi:DNA-binding NarL/FixJ family response regulator
MKRKTAQPKTSIRVMLVDDHPSVREALRTIIDSESDLTVVAEADSGRAALQLFNRAKPDVVLMDGSMPDMGGIETTRRLRERRADVKIIGLTLYQQSTYLEEMAETGAKGYILKTSDPANMVKAVRIVAAGGTYFDPAIPRQSPVVASQTCATEDLSEDELSVAKLVANGHTNAEIATALDLTVRALDTYRTAAMKKLGLTTRAQLVRVATQRRWLKP